MLKANDIKQNIEALQDFMKKEGVSFFYISSFDPYLNEYVPIGNCRRYYVTGFRGSVAEVLVPAQGKVKLYVDGRYHEQADNQCDLSLVEVVKVKNQSNLNALFEDLAEAKAKNVGIEADRTSLSFFKKLEDSFPLKVYKKQELDSFIKMKGFDQPGKIERLDVTLTGESTKNKLDRILKNSNEAFYVTALDSLAWLSNGRGYHLPFMSSFLGKGLATKECLYIFIEPGIEHDRAFDKNNVQFVEVEIKDLSRKLKEILDLQNIEKVSFDPAMVNTSDYLMLEVLMGQDNLNHVPLGITPFQAIKNETEIKEFEKSFAKAAKAIFDTINWLKDQKSESVSEADLYKKTSEMYKKHGARTQSFNTISGAGENGSIIHYGEPKEERKIKDEDMCLLDSGAYFEAGLSTDCTRTFLAGRNVKYDPQYKKMYTYTLKGFLRAQSAIFPEGTRGLVIDGLARNPMMQIGWNYAHGTGHGVGVHVHEGATGVNSLPNNVLNPGHVVSIEPGIYFPGVGGVRIENVCVVEKHPDFEGFCRFKPLIYLGLEKELIDFDLLTFEEKEVLEQYEAECAKRGTSFN